MISFTVPRSGSEMACMNTCRGARGAGASAKGESLRKAGWKGGIHRGTIKRSERTIRGWSLGNRHYALQVPRRGECPCRAQEPVRHHHEAFGQGRAGNDAGDHVPARRPSLQDDHRRQRSENSEHRKIAAALKASFFFCHPYHSWEKGTVENRNGVIRRYLPRSTDLSQWSQDELDEIAADINTTPMKCLGYQTPSEVLSARCTWN